MAVPSESVKRYIFVKGGPDKPLNKLVKFKNGVGVRAVAMAGAHSDFSHFLAIEGTSLQQVIALSKALPVAQNQTMSLMSCTTPDCTGFLDGILHTLHTPSYMPPFEFCAFAYVELHVGLGKPGKPALKLSCEGQAAVAIKGGNRVLIEIGSKTQAKVGADLEKIHALKGVKSIRVLRTGSSLMHRATP